MSARSRFFRSIGILIFILLNSCASGPKLASLPEQAIDRKLVLPEDVSAWRPLIGHAFESEDNTFVYPFHWEQGYTERLTLIWMPLPLELRYLLVDGPGYGLAVDAALLGSVYSRDKNFNWRPSLELRWKQKVSDRVAYETEAMIQGEIKKSDQGQYGRLLSLRGGVMTQLSRTAALTLSLAVWNESGEIVAPYLGVIPVSGGLRFPVLADFSWLVHPQWELGVKAGYLRWGYEDGYTGLPVYLSVAHYW